MSKLQLTYLFETEDELRAHLGASTRIAAEVAAPAVATVAAGETTETEIKSDAAVDADGMPYDPEVHSESRAVTEAGLWKAKRGRAAQAEAARAAFKAKGAGMAAPVVAAAAAMPGLAAPATMPGMPVAAAVRAPVSFDAVVAKLTDLMGRGKVQATELGQLYAAAGAAGPEQFETDETARAKLMDLLVARDI